MLVGQRPQAINALPGHAAAFGVIAAKGTGNVDMLLSALVDDPATPEIAKVTFAQTGRHMAELEIIKMSGGWKPPDIC
jgi:hypothetical protein